MRGLKASKGFLALLYCNNEDTRETVVLVQSVANSLLFAQ